MVSKVAMNGCFGYFPNHFPNMNDLVQDPSETTIWDLKSNCSMMDGNGEETTSSHVEIGFIIQLTANQ